ncbi:hypothetical protein JTB14_017692 [Gonioctena quinquepunctata]|nr:hypothetical protein JTB14_017692 [Gonioctena quinquepunctata]
MFFSFYLYLMYASGVLYFVSTCVNPVLYHIMSNKFRKAFKNTFREVCGCKEKNRGYYSSIRRVSPESRNVQRSMSEVTSSSPGLKTANSKMNRNNSKISTTSRSSFMSTSSRGSSLYDRNKCLAFENGKSAEPVGKKFFILPLNLSRIFGGKRSNQTNNATISNSSLKDTDVTEFNNSDLVSNMLQINEDIMYSLVFVREASNFHLLGSLPILFLYPP